MTNSVRTLLTTVLAAGLVAGANAADLKPEEQIETRQAGYSFMSWNMKKIKANLDGDYNQPTVQAAANRPRPGGMARLPEAV